MNTREFVDRGSVLLGTLVAISFDDKVSHKAKNVAEGQKSKKKKSHKRKKEKKLPLLLLMQRYSSKDLGIQSQSLHQGNSILKVSN